MGGVTIHQVDAFADRPFAGNPAAVCVLERFAGAAWMQSVAAEMNLAETAFVVPRPAGGPAEVRQRPAETPAPAESAVALDLDGSKLKLRMLAAGPDSTEIDCAVLLGVGGGTRIFCGLWSARMHHRTRSAARQDAGPL